MSYADTSDIQNEFKNLTFSDTTAVTPARVVALITQAEAEVDAKIGQVYVAPIDPGASPVSFQIVLAISIGIVAQRVRDILEVKSPEQESSQGVRKDSASDARKRLDQIVARTLPLPDAVLVSTTKGATSFDAGSTDVKFTFRRGKNRYGGPNQW